MTNFVFFAGLANVPSKGFIVRGMKFPISDKKTEIIA